MKIAIYVLTDPRDGQVRYVGQTKRSLARRLNAHILNSKELRTHRDCWIAGLMSQGFRPLIQAVEECADDWPERERHWIELMRGAGADLTNRTDGGEGTHGTPVSEKNRRASAERQAMLMQNLANRANLSARVAASWTAERRAAKALETAARMTPDVRAAKSVAQNEPAMVAHQRKMQESVWTPARRAQRSAQVKAQMTPERRAAHSAALRETMASPEWKARHSHIQKNKWTPEMREAQAARTRAQFAAKRAAQGAAE